MTLFILLAAFGPGPEAAPRPVEIWTYSDLFKKADMVVVARLDSERSDKNEPVEHELHQLRRSVESLISKLRVLAVFKGTAGQKLIEVRHHRFRKGGPGVNNGPQFIEFKAKEHYLVFLKKRADERFEPVTGHMDSELSVMRLEPRAYGDIVDDK